MRGILEAVQNASSTEVQPVIISDCKQTGISPGWVVLGVVIGIIIGNLGTILAQCICRRRQEQLPASRFPVTRTAVDAPPHTAPQTPYQNSPAVRTANASTHIVSIPHASPLYTPLQNSLAIVKSHRHPESKPGTAYTQPSSHPSSTDIAPKSDQRALATIPRRAPAPPQANNASSPYYHTPTAAPPTNPRQQSPSATSTHSPTSAACDLVNPFAVTTAASEADSNPFLTPPDTTNSRPGSAGAATKPPAQPPARAASPTVPRDLGQELEAACDGEALDPSWGLLLDELDRRLAARGEGGMSGGERRVAVASLGRATGSRGAEAALQGALEEVLLARRRG